jgi:hypothetical protein
MNNTQKTVVFDIETAPSDELVEKNTKPFDPSTVKLGNLKDEEKIAAKLAEAENRYYENAYKKAALDPITGYICAIGIGYHDDKPEILTGDESNILKNFWMAFEGNANDNWAYYTGSNNKTTFDIRFILMRSWMNKVKVPWGIVTKTGYFNGAFVDLAQIYLAGADYVTYCGLSRAAEQMNLIGEDVGFATVRSKDELKLSTGVTGANFHELLVSDPKAADTYLINDLALTRALADRILC